jgi:serine/threonine protein kinase/tetratricopeptide (TPR) repeat protein
MTPERWQKLKDLCNLALEREPSDRNSFLAEACQDDGELRREAESMIARATSGGGILNGPIWNKFGGELPGVPGQELLPWQPATIGHFRILRVLGEGGMGIVYEAEQDHPRRHVALKVIKLALANAQMLRRFDRESQALARLHHQGIAHVYEAGTAETEFGPAPYFAMEFIRGTHLCQYAESRRLATRERLEIMAKVCEAVEHAHQNGIIHRDLKPGNILVDETGQPKILDFGVARVTNSDIQVTRQTDVGQLIGTLAYMSPEQVTADTQELDARSDVYALGVILYELLANRLPYPLSQQLPEAVRAIREEDPTRLSFISRRYRGDIETIVGKALEKDKRRRYASAAALATDIRKYLTDEPIAARPPSPSYQLRKFVRRHKSLAGATVAFFAVLAAGVIVSTAEAVNAHRAQLTAEAVNDFLRNDLLAQAGASTQAGPGTKTDPDLKVRTALDRAATRIGGKFERQPEVEAAIRDTIGQTYLDLGLYPEARSQFERALELRRRVLGAKNPDTLQSVSSLGAALLKLGKFPEAEALLDQNLETERHVLGSTNSVTLDTMNNLGHVYTNEGKYQSAEAIHSEALKIRRRVNGPENPLTLSSMTALANDYEEDDKFDQAEPLYTQALEIERRVLGPEHPRVLAVMNDLANVYFDDGKYLQAEALYTQTLEGRRRVLGPEHPDTLSSMMNLAISYRRERKRAQAEALDSQTLAIERRVLGVEHRLTLMCMNNLANLYQDEGKYAQAETLQAEAVEVKSRVLGTDHPDTLISMSNLANTYAAEGNYEQAEPLLKRTLQMQQNVLGPLNTHTLGTLSDLALMYQREGDYALAEKYAGEALAGRRQALGPEHPETVGSAADLALAYLSRSKFSEAEQLSRAVVAFERKNQSEDWSRFFDESELGASLAGEKKYADAEPLLIEGYQTMLVRKDEMTFADRYYLDRAHEWIVHLYLLWGKPAEAARWRKRLDRNSGFRRGPEGS